MNVPLISPAAPPTARMDVIASRADTGPTEFSGTLSQQRGQLHDAQAARASGRHAAPDSASHKGTAATDEAERPLTPQETLALLAAGASLPLMVDGASTAVQPGAADNAQQSPDGKMAAPVAAAAALAADAAAAQSAADTQTALADADPTDLTSASGAATLALAITAGPVHAGTGTHKAALTPNPIGQADDRTGATIDPALAGRADQGANTQTIGFAMRADASTRQTAAAADPSRIAQADRRPSVSPDTLPLAAPRTDASLPMTTGAQPIPAGFEASGAQVVPAGFATSLAMQPAPAAAGTAAATPLVATPLGDPAWPNDFGRQVLALNSAGANGIQTAELRLNPPDLGPVRIVLHISDSVTQALFISPHAAIRHTIENALPQLQQQMAQAGLTLGQADVSDQPTQQQAFGQGDAQAQKQSETTVFALDGQAPASAQAPMTDTAPRRAVRSPDALVDTFV